MKINIPTTTLDYLSSQDPILANLIHTLPPVSITIRPAFTILISSIIGQLIRLSEARKIRSNLYSLLNSNIINPEQLQKLTDSELLSTGLSHHKLNLIREVTSQYLNGTIFLATPEHIIGLKIKGIGPWTKNNIMIYGFGNLDIFLDNDISLQNAIKKLYGLSKKPTQGEINSITQKWKPYRTVGCLYLWKYLE